MQWKKARNTKSPTKQATVSTSSTSRSPLTIELPSSSQLPTAPSVQLEYIERQGTPPVILRPESPICMATRTPTQSTDHSSTPGHIIDATVSIEQSPEAGPSRASPASSASIPLADDKQSLTENHPKGPNGKDCAEIKKRKASAGTPSDITVKASKLPKVDPEPATVEAVKAKRLAKLARKALAKAQRSEETALNGEAGPLHAKKAKKTASEKKKIRREKEEKQKSKQAHIRAHADKLKTGPTSAHAISLPKAPALSSAIPSAHMEQRKGNEGVGNSNADKGKAKAKDVVDLSGDGMAHVSAKGDALRGKDVFKDREIVDLTKESSSDKVKPPTTSASARPSTKSSSIPQIPVVPARTPTPTSSRPLVPPGLAIRPSQPARIPVTRAQVTGSAGPRPIPRPPSTAAARPPTSSSAPFRASLPNDHVPPPPFKAIRPPPSTSLARPPPNAPVIQPTSGASTRPPPPRPMQSRPPTENFGEIGRTAPPPQYHAPAGYSSYSERQALAALARPSAGQPVRPAGTKFTPSVPGRPAAPARPPHIRPSTSVNPSQNRSMNGSSTLSSSSPLGATDMMPSRSLTPAVTTPRYIELRRLLSEKMEEMDNWTSMLSDLPDRAEMTQRQIDRTRQECFVLQKQMRDEKDKVNP